MTQLAAARLDTAKPPSGLVRTDFRAMATDVSFQVYEPSPDAEQAIGRAQAVFARVEAACTRFDDRSPLMQANAAGDDWQVVPQECFDALTEAASAHRETGGLFDPRVLDALAGLGYDRSLPFEGGSIELRTTDGDGPAGPATLPRLTSPIAPWTPGFDPDGLRVRVGPRRVDLGGIGKGLAVRWAARELAGAGTAQLIDAGGDCYLAGPGPVGHGWRVGVEDPFVPRTPGDPRGAGPLAVLELRDLGCATSSLRKRAWTLDGLPVHHLIDPRSGRSAAGGLRAVTVAGPDPAMAEVWSKSLLIAGRGLVAELARERGLAALWVDDEGRVGMSDVIAPLVIWEAQP